MYLVECRPDAVLVISLTSASKKNIIHAGNKSELLKRLTERQTNSKGIIDEDPWSVQPPHLQKFEETQNLTNYKFKILRHATKNNILIILRPRLEEWILEAANEVNVDVRTYNLPNDATTLHEQINIRIDKFQELVQDLKRKSNRMKVLKAHLREWRQKN
jgi:hypothetical protein